MGFDYVYWVKVITAVAYGYISAYGALALDSALYTYVFLFTAVVIYITLAEIIWRMGGMKVRRRQSYLNGAGGYAGVYLLTWLMFFNLLA
ncbi:MAG: hypothetical protein QXX19_01475 [Candidatus Caldarchaeum sp.]